MKEHDVKNNFIAGSPKFTFIKNSTLDFFLLRRDCYIPVHGSFMVGIFSYTYIFVALPHAYFISTLVISQGVCG